MRDRTRIRRRRRPAMTLAGLVAAALTAVLYQCQAPKPPQSQATRAPAAATTAATPPAAAANTPGAFDFYLLDVTHESAWCDDGNARQAQCRRLDRAGVDARPLVLHGLWPENLAPGSYPSQCSAQPLRLSPALRQRLAEVMPGSLEGLDEHEWRKHGSCTGLDAETYFNESIRLAERINTALAPTLRSAAGGSTSGATLRASLKSSDPELADSVVFVCKNLRAVAPQNRRRPYLVSVRVCIDNDGPDGRPASLLRCEAVQRRDQGCGRSFFVDDL